MGSSAPAGEANIIATSAPVLIDASKRSTLSPLQIPPGQYEVPPWPAGPSRKESSDTLGFCTLCAVTVCVVSRNREVGLSAIGAGCHGAAAKEEAPGGASIIGRSSLGGVSGVRLGRTARLRGFCAAWTFLSCLNLKQRVFLADFRVMGICFRLVQASGRRKGQARSRDGHACASAAVR